MNQLAVAIAIVLFPGLISSVICDKVTVHNQRWDTFKYAIYSFLFGLISYTLLQGLVSLLAKFDRGLPGLMDPVNGILSAWSLVSEEKYRVNLAEVLWATLLAPFVAACAAATVNLKLVNLVAHRLHISRKYGDENLFSFFLNADGLNWVYVRDKSTSLTYCGKIVSFSECAGAQEIVLSEVEVFNYESSEKLYQVALVYLARPIGSFVIEVPSVTTGGSDDSEETHNRRDHEGDNQSPVNLGDSRSAEERDPSRAAPAATAS